ncbi:MAG TPA: imidazolonepropionase [Gammaproteobacteria bacterium]|nr:imidazolonepropionase [Gammaproteobacteria bacterium]
MTGPNSETAPASPDEWDHLWIDARVATMRAGDGTPYGAIEDGAVAVRAGRIVWVGERSALPADAAAVGQVHSAGGRWITPGLIDCHTHLVHAGNRAREFEMRLQGSSYEEIAGQGGGILSTVRETRAAEETALVDSARARLKVLLSEGVTAVEIKSGYGLDRDTELRMLRAARRLGEIEPVTVVTTFLGAHALAPEYEGRGDEYIDFVCQEVMPAAAEGGLADAVDAFCERIGFSLAQTERVFRAARNLGLPIKLHAEQLSDSGGAELAARFGALSADHLEYISEAGVAAMAKSGTAAVLLPGAFYFLRETRVPPVDLFRRHNVPMAIASDNNPGSSPSCSLLLMLNMACTLFRMTPEEALAGVTRNAAVALGRDSAFGTLEIGKRADFVLWDVDHPAELAYRIGFNPRHAVIRGGDRLDGEV